LSILWPSVPKRSSPNSSHWVKSMPFMGRYQSSSRPVQKQPHRRGKGCRITSLLAHTMEWRNG
jgi:hypothetical protein